ncbi:conserved hypothetical protein [Rubrivivax sp. A210]|nr:conserved hypothetical protein [Rubrivivax sp. A210]
MRATPATPPDPPPAAQAPPAAPPAVPPAVPPGTEPPPVYATRLPPPFTRTYGLRRGAASGLATLQWAPDETGYTLTLAGEGAAAAVASRRSEGGFDFAGLAPARYSESRRGRELRAVNFRREAGLISYSGPSTLHPLLAGAQDRLSWMLQLAAVLAANPALAEPGAELKMLVAGTRGDAEVWTFAVAGPEAVELADGRQVAALRLEREPAGPWDWRVQAWLDPADHHLPLRLRLLLRASGEGSEFLLRP